jgi:hypothetical protein
MILRSQRPTPGSDEDTPLDSGHEDGETGVSENDTAQASVKLPGFHGSGGESMVLGDIPTSSETSLVVVVYPPTAADEDDDTTSWLGDLSTEISDHQQSCNQPGEAYTDSEYNDYPDLGSQAPVNQPLDDDRHTREPQLHDDIYMPSLFPIFERPAEGVHRSREWTYPYQAVKQRSIRRHTVGAGEVAETEPHEVMGGVENTLHEDDSIEGGSSCVDEVATAHTAEQVIPEMMAEEDGGGTTGPSAPKSAGLRNLASDILKQGGFTNVLIAGFCGSLLQLNDALRGESNREARGSS